MQRTKTTAKNGVSFFGRDSTQAVIMLLPVLIGFLVFTYIPIFYILRFAFYTYDGFKAPVFTGLANFVRIFQRDKAFWESFANTLVLAFGKLVLEIPLALLFAVLLNQSIKGAAAFRVILFLPTIISTAIVGLVFSLMFAAYHGVINSLLQDAGLITTAIDWLGKKWSAMFVIGLASIWAYLGINMIFFLMALQSVPKELYECATLDGCTGFKRFRMITMPMIAPIFRVVLLNAIVGSLKVNDLILSSTNGQPAGKTEVIMTYIFKYFFGLQQRRFEVGYASAMSMVTAVFLGVVTFAYLKFSNSMNNE